MENSNVCPLCGFRINTSEEVDVQKFHRVGHMVDHALRAVHGLGVYDVGDIDVCGYRHDATTWKLALAAAVEYIKYEYGDHINDMVNVIAKLPIRPIGGDDSSVEYITIDVPDSKKAMLEFLENLDLTLR